MEAATGEMTKAPKVGFLIPCLDEAASVGAVVRTLRHGFPDAVVVVIDDGSTDDTAEVAARAGALVARLWTNMGIATACLAGLAACKELGCERIVRLDGDGQHSPEDVARLLAAEQDLVIGSRYLEGSRYTSAMRAAGINILRLALRVLHGRWISDPTSGFRAYSRRFVEWLLEQQYPADYPEPEELAAAMASGRFSIGEAPVRILVRQHGRSSIDSFKSAYFMAKVCTSLLLRRALFLR